MTDNILELINNYKNITIKHKNNNVYRITGTCSSKFGNNWVGICITYSGITSPGNYVRHHKDFENFEIVELTN